MVRPGQSAGWRLRGAHKGGCWGTRAQESRRQVGLCAGGGGGGGGGGVVPLLILTWVWLPGPGCLEPGQDGQLGLSLGSCSCRGRVSTPLCYVPCFRALRCSSVSPSPIPQTSPHLHAGPLSWGLPTPSLWQACGISLPHFISLGLSLPTSLLLFVVNPLLVLLWASKLLYANPSPCVSRCLHAITALPPGSQTLLLRSKESRDMGYLADKSPARKDELELRFSVE